MNFFRALSLLFFLLFVSTTNTIGLLAQSRFDSGTRFSGMSNSSVALVDFWSIAHNQAGLAYIDNTSFGFHHQSMFVLSQLGMSSMALVVPQKMATLGVQLSRYGFDKFNETKVGLAVAKKLNSKFALGMQLDYFNSYQYGIEPINRITFEGGILAHVNENFRLGFKLFNPLPSKNRNEYYSLSTVFRLGAAYYYSEKGFLTAEIEQDLDNESIVKAGVEYFLNEKIKFRTGVSTGVTQLSFGMGYEFERLTVDMAFSMQEILGISPFASIQYTLK